MPRYKIKLNNSVLHERKSIKVTSILNLSKPKSQSKYIETHAQRTILKFATVIFLPFVQTQKQTRRVINAPSNQLSIH